MIQEGCQGHRGAKIQEKICPRCGSAVELFSTDVSVTCETCGCEIYNDLVDCVQWCDKARECVGEELYARLMAAGENISRKMQEIAEDDEW